MNARIDVAELRTRLAGGAWADVLRQAGIAEEYLRGKQHPGPCPMCGGRDRYFYDDRHGRGDYFCRQCGPGDGLELMQKLLGLSFPKAVQLAAQIAGVGPVESIRHAVTPRAPEAPAAPTRRVFEVLRGSCTPSDVADVREYLASRGLWPLPPKCALRAHASLEYFQDMRRVGRYAALVAGVSDVTGARVTAHVTYLAAGRKLDQHEPRKILSPMTGREGCAVRLMPLTGDTLGIAEGIETALSASVLHGGIPTWAALNTSLLMRFEPPATVRHLVVFADRDAPGLGAAAKLIERLQGRVTCELQVPEAPHDDWNDKLGAQA